MKLLCSRTKFLFLIRLVIFICFLSSFIIGSTTAQNRAPLSSTVFSEDRAKDNCEASYTALLHQLMVNNPDTINKYTTEPLQFCDINDAKQRNSILIAIEKLIKLDFYNLDTSIVDSIGNQIIDPNTKLEYFTHVSGAYMVINDERKFEKYWAKANEALPHADDDNSRILYYNLYGFKNFSVGNIFSAFQIYRLAASFDKADMKHQIVTMNELGNMYTSIGENEKAIEIFKKVISTATESNDLAIVRFGYFGLMNSYYNEKQYKKLIETAYESIDYHLEEDIKSLLGYTYCIMGDGYLALSKLDSAKHYYLKGVDISIANKEYKELKDNYYALGAYYKHLGDTNQARNYYDKALEINTYFPYPEIYRDLSDLWKIKGDYREAYNSLRQYADVTEKQEKANLSDVKLATQIIEDSYTFRQEAEAKIVQTQRRQERLLLIIIAGIIALVLVSSFLYLLNKNGKRLKELNDKVVLRNKDLDIAMNKQKDTIRYLENFASVAAHDLKAPIRTASSFAGLLTKTTSEKLSEKELSFLNYINSSVSKLSLMIDDLLSLSKLDVDLPPVEKIDLNELLDKVKSQLHKLINETNSQIILETKLPIVEGHETLIMQLFQNIMKNSITHNKTQNRTIIKISSKKIDDNWIAIEIADNSGGIPESILPSLFNLFESSDKNNGNGIGLATCKKIVNHYGGDIWVDVDGKSGSTFHFTLPARIHASYN